jgi:F1F0 ATPase subunit 2
LIDLLALMGFVVLTFAVGAALGWLFYAGLYRTVRELVHARRPALLVGVSLLVRMAVLLAGLWLVLRLGTGWFGGEGPGGGWLALVPALLGLLVVRTLLLHRYGRPGDGGGDGHGRERHTGDGRG